MKRLLHAIPHPSFFIQYSSTLNAKRSTLNAIIFRFLVFYFSFSRFLFFTFHFSFFTFTLPLAAQQHYYYSLRRITTSQANHVDTIPLEWTNQKVFVNVLVNGKPMRMLIDTGASMSILYQHSVAVPADSSSVPDNSVFSIRHSSFFINNTPPSNTFHPLPTNRRFATLDTSRMATGVFRGATECCSGPTKGSEYHIRDGGSEGWVFLPLGHITMYDAHGAATQVQVVQTSQFSIGSINVSHYPMLVMPQPPGLAKCDGVLGFDLINKGLIFKIDTKARQLVVSHSPIPFCNEKGHTLVYRLQRFVPYVKLKLFSKMKELMAFDTGCSAFCLLNHTRFFTYESKHPHEVETQVESRLIDHTLVGTLSTESASDVVALSLNALQWKALSFCHVNALTTHGRSRIGAPILQHGALLINGINRTMQFQPYNMSDSVSISIQK